MKQAASGASALALRAPSDAPDTAHRYPNQPSRNRTEDPTRFPFLIDAAIWCRILIAVHRKKEVVLRLLRGEPVDAISREVSVPIYRLEEWRERALAGMDAGLKERESDPLEAKLGEATRRIGELVMEVEILRKERQARHPLGNRRSSK